MSRLDLRKLLDKLTVLRAGLIGIAFAVAFGGYAVTQGYSLSGAVQPGTALSPSISGPSDVANGINIPSGTSSHITVTKHLSTTTLLQPALSSCGTSPVLTTGSSDMNGSYTTGSGATTCTLTFGATYVTAPTCVQSAQGTATQPTFTTTATTLVNSVDIASTVYNYFCVAKAGG